MCPSRAAHPSLSASMDNSPTRSPSSRRFAASLLLAAGLGAGLWWWQAHRGHTTVASELPRASLVLRDGCLQPVDGGGPFTGLMFEQTTKGQRLTAVPVVKGIVHGMARGWYDSGKLEMEEPFENGLSHGLRTRWHENGQKKSEAHIQRGQLHGHYSEWHPNGQLALTMTMECGQSQGLCQSWNEDGTPKSKVTLKDGQPIAQEYFNEPKEAAGQ
jgi:MORN repeat variant